MRRVSFFFTFVWAIGLTSCFFIHRDAPPASLLRLRRKDLETLLGDGLEKASFFIFDFRFIRVSFYSSTIRAIGLTACFFFNSQVTTQSRLRCLQHVSLLKSLSDDQRTTLVQLLQPRQYTEGEVVFNQGDAGDKFYIVETGNVAIHR